MVSLLPPVKAFLTSQMAGGDFPHTTKLEIINMGK